MVSPNDIVPFLKLLSSESAKIINPLFANPDLKIEWKSDDTPVTYADRKAEEVMRSLISKHFPDHGIIGEEFPNTNEGAEFTWVLDPIDGTRAFAAGSPHFGTLICLRKNEQPLWGVINVSTIGRCYIGNNETAWCNDRPLQIGEPKPLSDCFLVTTDPKDSASRHNNNGWNKLLQSTGQFRSWGDCFGYTLLATGGVDIMCDPILNIWDLAALLPILKGAGIGVTDWSGLDPAKSDSLVAAHPKLLPQVIDILNNP